MSDVATLAAGYKAAVSRGTGRRRGEADRKEKPEQVACSRGGPRIGREFGFDRIDQAMAYEAVGGAMAMLVA